jgi:hypothetical protein
MAATTNNILLVGNDSIEVAFDATHINQLSYIKELLIDLNENKINVDIPSKYLLLLYELLTLKDIHSTPFKQRPKIKTYREIKTKVPVYSGIDDPWASTKASGIYYNFLTTISTEDLCILFTTTDYLGCDDALHGIAYVLIQHMLNYTDDVRKHLSAHSKSILAKIHIANI